MINKLIMSLVCCVGLFGASCSFSMAKAESNPANKETSANESNVRQAKEQNDVPAQPAKMKVVSVAGKYDRDTEKNGEGYDNSLEVTDAGGGKVYIYISGSYIYKIGETQSMHESEGKGDATLTGNKANAILVDEAGKPCHATIIFHNDTANVKIPDTCQFNVALDGVYKKGEPKAEQSEITRTDETDKLGEISYEKMMDFVNDFETRKVGDEFMIIRVPPAILDEKTKADEFGNRSYQGLYYLQGVKDDDSPSYTVLTSKQMIKSLNENAGFKPVTLRMTAVIVESKGKFDIYRVPFITKTEALDDEGGVIWTAEGGQPAKLKFTH